MWRSGQDGYVSCGIVGRTGMYHVAYWGGWVCIVWRSGQDGYVCFGIVGRRGMYHDILGRTGMYRLA